MILSAGLDLVSLPLAEVDFTPTRFLGRLHPILVHFPIALILFAAAAELWRAVRRIETPSPLTLPLVVASALTAVAASGAGWFNAAWEHAGESGDTLQRHRWLGTIITVVLIALAAFIWRTRSARPLDSAVTAQRFGTILCAAVIGLVGHLGGELVYGEGYLWKGLGGQGRTARESRDGVAPALPAKGTPAEIFYLTRVKPILIGRCAECHGESKQKGGLRLDPIGMAFDGPADAWSIVPGFPDDSELVIRVELPADDPDVMPSKGEKLSVEETALLRRWIEEGAVVPASERAAVEAAEPSSASAVPLSPAVTHALEQCTVCGAIATPLYVGSGLFEVNASRATPPWTDVQLELVAQAADAIASLNLARSQVTDIGLAALPSLPSLEFIRLDDTMLGDDGIAPLLKSPKLSRASLIGTRVSDEGLARLLELESLREVYVWRSRVTEAGMAAAKVKRPDVEVIGSEPPPPAPQK
jgi:uncharacterized membrane protein/mono/diheme cytochrome c family protein